VTDGNGFRPAVATLLGFAFACGSGHADSASPPSNPQADACGHYYDVFYGGGVCRLDPLPAAESRRQRARFVRACQNQFALPGSTVTPADVSACADASICGERTPAACLSIGTLAAGAACNSSSQCSSASCSVPAAGCGTCSVSTPDGKSCAHGSAGGPGGCGPHSLCDTTMPNWTCIPAPSLDVGAPCPLPDECKPGLYCHIVPPGPVGTCARASAAGDSCSMGAECAYPLFCNTNLKCQSPEPAGSTCAYDADCVRGLACDSYGMTCKPVAWVGAGQACTNSVLKRCLVGNCDILSGACPTVMADGQRCDTTDSSTTCDAFAVCFNGTCTLKDGAVCT
jgi:hypothetical protein